MPIPTRPLRAALAAILLAASVAAAGAAEATTIRVLLLSGRNNHDWKTTTPALVKILEASGRFTVTVENDPPSLGAGDFAKYGVIVSNWTPWPNIKQRVWDAETEKAFLEFVRGGKGMVVFHAASTAMQTWPEYQQIVCATWGMGQTGHGRRHEFKVKITDKAHPVTSGLADFDIFDELWHRVPVQSGAKALCTAFSAKANGGTDQDEAVAFHTRFGKGRGFNLVLGHDVRAMSCPGWQALMLRGTEWAATGKVTIAATSDGAPSEAQIDAALKAAGGYRFGTSRAPLVAVEKLVNAAAAGDAAGKAKLATKLAGVLASSEATTDGKEFICGQLSLIGSDAEVPALAALLGDAKLSLAARSALERLPGEASLTAMRAALAKATGSLRVGLIDSLGVRKDAKAVGPIAGALTGADAAAATAAAAALGTIGGLEASGVLRATRAKIPPAARGAAADALLKCAAGLRAAGQMKQAAAIYEDLSAAGEPRHVRVAAFPGLVACRQDAGAELMLTALGGTDRAMQLAAVRAVRLIGDEKLLKPLIDRLPSLSPPVRTMIIGMLAERRAVAALPAVVRAASDDDAGVRRAAVAAMGRLGDASTVAPLAKMAAERSDAEQRLARTSLVRLRGEAVDATMIAKLTSSPSPIRRELIVALTQRRAGSAVAALLGAAGEEDRAIRSEAVKGLTALADAKHCPALIALLGRASSDADRWGLEAALVAACRRSVDPARAPEPILAALEGADAKRTASLLSVLGRLGGAKALAAVRKAARSGDADTQTAAIRALGDWADATPLEDLLAVAKTATQPVPRVLALRGFAKLSAKATDRKSKRLAGLYRQAFAVADRAEDKKTLLGGLAGVGGPAALELACDCLAEPALVNEAALAATKIADTLWKSRPDPTRRAMRQVLAAKVSQLAAAEATRILVELSKPRNIALDAKATSPDGLESDGQASGDQAAIDGNPGTYWDEANGAKLYRLVVTFPEPRKVAVLRITGFNHHDYAPKDFDVLCDGKVVKAVRNAQYSDNRLTLAVPQTACKTVELKITGYYGASPAVRELEIFAIDPLKSIERE